MRACVDGLVAISRTVADLGLTEAFYRDGLDFRRLGPVERIPAAMLEALGLPDAGGGFLRMGLGRQSIEFLAFDAPGQRYPVGARADDPWFQHAALVVADMDRAFARVEALGPVPISRGGPQVLPPSSGGVTAWKFRDPDGHPLELIAFPEGGAGPWARAPGLFAGIDHSAIAVTGIAASLAFFREALGLQLTARGLNAGPAQAALDGLPDPVVDVIALTPSGVATPHVELLHYRRPAAPAAPLPLTARDRATSRLCFGVDDLPGLLARLAERQPHHTVRRSGDGRMAGLTGPDGHGILLMGRQDMDGSSGTPA